MTAWTFRCYNPTSGGRGGFLEWWDALAPRVMADAEQALLQLEETKRWDEPLYKDLEGACAGLGEIRIDLPTFDEDGNELGRECYRILCSFGPGKRDCTLLCGFHKITGSEYSTECPKALQRKQGVERDERRSQPFEIPED